MSEWKITMLANEHCETGENPLWDGQRECVYWADIPNGKIFRYDLAWQSHEQIYSDVPVGGFTLQTDGSLLLFRVSDIAILPWRGVARTIIKYSDDGMERFNDVSADPEGRVFAGTIGKTETSGGLYRVDLDGTITKLFDGTGCANGSGFSPDLQMFYWTCSTTKRLFRFRYHRETGELTERTEIYRAQNEGTPDGLTVDAEGNLWSARWDGQTIVKHAPDGSVLGKIKMPVKTISSVCFGGSDYAKLFVTTASGKSCSSSEDGALFQIEGNFRGKPEFHSRISLA